MGWGNCGEDTKHRPIGYDVSAECDHPDCTQQIDRGLSYVCGSMHGDDAVSCELYFCSDHCLNFINHDDTTMTICNNCAKELLDSGDWIEDDNEGVIRQK